MRAGQKLQENGVEVALYPEPQVIVTQEPHGSYSHQNIEAMDCGGEGVRIYYAPCTLEVKQNNDPCDHRVLYWSVNPVKTHLHGTTHISIMVFHNNDVSYLPVGRVIPQGELAWTNGGQGYKGAYTYPFHSHINIAIGHQDVFENGQLRNSVRPDEVLFANDTQIIQTLGMNFVNYVPKELANMEKVADMLFCPQMCMNIREYPTIESEVVDGIKSTTEVEVLEKSTNLIDGHIWLKLSNGYCALLNENWLYPKQAQNIEVIEPVIETSPKVEPVTEVPVIVEEPLQPIIEPVVEELPKDEQVIVEVENNAPKPQETVIEPVNDVKTNVWVELISKIIQFILKLLKSK